MPQPVTISFAKNPRSKSDTIVFFVGPDRTLQGMAADIDSRAAGIIKSALATRGTFKGRHGDVLGVFLPDGSAYKQVLLFGSGEIGKFDALAAENAGGKILVGLRAMGARNAAIAPGSLAVPGMDEAQTAALIASGIRLRDYAFDKYKSKPEAGKTGDSANDDIALSITLVTEKHSSAARAHEMYAAVEGGVRLARDLVNEVPNILYPESYAAILQRDLKPLGVEVEILDEKKMEKLGFKAHLAVGMGSDRPPRVVILRWNGLSGGKARKGATGPLAFVGKGVTFDTGGISIKPAAGMEEMKMDMGGSAAVAGLIRALAVRKAKVDVVGILGLAENMPSGRSYRPGDIIGSLSGKTIEVLNTDAEGRLVLADALTYVQKTYKPRLVVDLATLTGAIMVALGYEYAGAFANDDALWEELDRAGRATGEKLWRMPLDEAYREEMKGGVSDLKNLGNQGRYGGACSAAGFLEHFIEPGVRWAHLDIAATAWGKSDKPTVPKGGSGFGVRLLHRFVADHYEQ